MREISVASTLNQRGFTYSLTSFGKAFVEFTATADKPGVDIGAAFGVATLPTILRGGSVIAVDISAEHLLTMENALDSSLRSKLTTIKARFPDFDLAPGSVSAVYLSQVLPFLRGDEIEEGFRKIFRWLAPGGKVFVVSFTPFIRHVESFIPVYLERKQRGDRWGGYIEDLSRFCVDDQMFRNLPNQIHHVDGDDVKWALEKAGFCVDEVRYFGEEEGALPPGIRLDGRERVGVIATKPETSVGRWKPLSQVGRGEIPERIHQWLAKPFVLSKALARVCNEFKVTVTDQRLNPLHVEELTPLECFDMAYGYVRETALGDPGDPLVYARVTLPYPVYLKHRDALESLGSRPIGEALLYNNPRVVRSEFEVKRVTMNDELMFNALVHQSFFQAVVEKKAVVPEVWARRSRFTIGDDPLLITEVFLCNLPEFRE